MSTHIQPDGPATWHELTDAIRARHPAMYGCKIELLRRLSGYKRVDVKTVPHIVEALESRGIGYLPRPLPYDYNAPVALYQRGTEMGDLVQAVIDTHNGAELTQDRAKVLTEYNPVMAELGELVKQAELLATRMRELRGDMRRNIR